MRSSNIEHIPNQNLPNTQYAPDLSGDFLLFLHKVRQKVHLTDKKSSSREPYQAADYLLESTITT